MGNGKKLGDKRTQKLEGIILSRQNVFTVERPPSSPSSCNPIPLSFGKQSAFSSSDFWFWYIFTLSVKEEEEEGRIEFLSLILLLCSKF